MSDLHNWFAFVSSDCKLSRTLAIGSQPLQPHVLWIRQSFRKYMEWNLHFEMIGSIYVLQYLMCSKNDLWLHTKLVHICWSIFISWICIFISFLSVMKNHLYWQNLLKTIWMGYDYAIYFRCTWMQVCLPFKFRKVYKLVAVSNLMTC